MAKEGAKRCTGCGARKDPGEFHRRGAGRQSACKACVATRQRETYERDPNRRAAVARARAAAKAINLSFLREHFSTHPCVDCGERDLAVLEFDHVRGKKMANVSRLLTAALPRLQEEVAKCDVRCGNCHRRKTARERGWWIHEAVQRHKKGVERA